MVLPFQTVNKAGTAANAQGNKVGTKPAQTTVTLQGAPQQGPMIGGKPIMQRQGAQPLVIGQLGKLCLISLQVFVYTVNNAFDQSYLAIIASTTHLAIIASNFHGYLPENAAQPISQKHLIVSLGNKELKVAFGIALITCSMTKSFTGEVNLQPF